MSVRPDDGVKTLCPLRGMLNKRNMPDLNMILDTASLLLREDRTTR
jgi:hypothetical protein